MCQRSNRDQSHVQCYYRTFPTLHLRSKTSCAVLSDHNLSIILTFSRLKLRLGPVKAWQLDVEISEESKATSRSTIVAANHQKNPRSARCSVRSTLVSSFSSGHDFQMLIFAGAQTAQTIVKKHKNIDTVIFMTSSQELVDGATKIWSVFILLCPNRVHV